MVLALALVLVLVVVVEVAKLLWSITITPLLLSGSKSNISSI
jgi:hypothetical protein